MGFMKMPVTTFSCWPTRPAALDATKKLKEKPQNEGEKRKNT
ncbi:hypothetical protein Sesv_A0049 (plasmid) [Salmonella enterica subsp. enterica serovar Virchow str. SVQ1]|nr:hypothetical protein Sesv_A0049 [Salmonella enterica subsp. enterica serovar Virchow str. SVQ1]